MAMQDLMEEIEYHEKLLKTMLEYEDENGICKVSHEELSKRIKKNRPWIAKALKRLNAEDNCVEMINKGEYIIHYTNIKQRGLFPKIFLILIDMEIDIEHYKSEGLLTEKYNITQKTANIFRGYLALIFK